MELRDFVERLEVADIDATIYVRDRRDVQPSSEVVVAVEPDDGSPPVVGLEYLLEVAEAQDVVSVWRQWRPGAEATVEELCRAIVFYADNDAYLPV